MSHRELTDSASKAIDRVFADTSVDRETTHQSLERLSDEIAMMMDTIALDCCTGDKEAAP
jgi:hypothetical protein